MIYLFLKAAHVWVVLSWVSGLLMLSLVLAGVQGSIEAGSPTERRILISTRNWNQAVTAPSMILTWVIGTILAIKGGWFGAPWLIAKVIGVVALSGVQGVQTGLLRRLTGNGLSPPPSMVRAMPVITIAIAGLIVFLVITKPAFLA
ncbi:CopD family protein [Pseudomonas petrae]|uniref:Protoporphyrinogen IX oxidase n=1 Tax=Pseudomonas petrae TaxID=2912190 RepID=A0ABS9I4U6_9PSED|nr:CopD family protein [Pseudomonas petrae]MCF7532291.1 CopD family protein [Pseudomonas petrae]MCF7535923.1 CopD family protein [Pseudomonas petrae]MCF7542784.1 CopD family protein [Pseudomonas petrae]MCF7554987.1 CopD family protein [Pseudomonas petrae]